MQEWISWRKSMDKTVEFFSKMADLGFENLSADIQFDGTTPLIYKYVPPERVITCLPQVGNGVLRATQPAALNDPFECAVRSIFVEQSEEEGNLSFSEVLTCLSPVTPVSEFEVAEARQMYWSLFLRELLARQLSERFGVVSFGARPDQLLMWSHYASNCSGFVIGYDVMQLAKLTRREGGLRPVRYGESLPLIAGYEVLEESNINGLLSYKSSHWEYEQEWRMIVNLNDTIGIGKSDEQGQPVNVVGVPNEAVCRVYYTERTRPDVVAEIVERLSDSRNRYGTNEPVKMIQSTEKFEYEAETIEPTTVRLGKSKESE